MLFFIGIPLYQFGKRLLPANKKSSLAQAKERLEQARLDVEAARLNKEAEKLYDHLYEDVLKDDDVEEQEKHRRI
jgi:hypothetical protein